MDKKQTVDVTALLAIANQIKKGNGKESKTKNKHRAIRTVQPIRDIEDVQAARDYFLNQPQHYKHSHANIRNYALFVLGINCARRVSDLLALRVSDVRFDSGDYKTHVMIREQKTGKEARFLLNNDACDALDMLIKSGHYGQNDYLFRARKGDNQPIDYRSAWRIMKQMERAIGLDKKGINVGTHTMRKTAAYNIYRNTKDIMLVSKVLNHNNPSVTQRYVGIEQDDTDMALAGLNYGGRQ